MINLTVEIEIAGISVAVGKIIGTNTDNAQFIYDKNYLQKQGSRGISLSLPLQQESFSANATRTFFEGLLPEGFLRKCVAEQIHADTNDYLAILSVLGNECLGAIRITNNESPYPDAAYKLLQNNELKALAREDATKSVQLVTQSHLSLTGASGKVGLYFEPHSKKWYYPIGNSPSTHIVKQSHIRLKKIVTNERLCLLTAQNLGIEIPESFIVNVGSSEKEDILFATKRYDRKIDSKSKILSGLYVPCRLHQEDFAQALGIPAKNKYEKNNAGYLKKAMHILRTCSTDPITDQYRLWDICIFNYLIGNTDNHIKNISLLYSENLHGIRLAPAYDIVSTMIYESSTENMAMSIGGIYNINEINREAFSEEAKNIGLGRTLAIKKFDKMISNFSEAIQKATLLLKQQGFEDAETIKEQIMLCGGIKKYI